MTPLAIGVVPIAITIGVLLSSSELTAVQAVASGPMILAGASQLAALQLLDAGVAPGIVVVSALMVNARLMLYGAAFATWFGRERLHVRMLLAIPIVDQLYFICVPRFSRDDLDRDGRIAFYAGAAVWLYGTWWLAQLAAFCLGPRLLDIVGALAVVAPLALVGLLAKATADRPAVVAATVAAALACVAAPLPYNGALVIAALGGTVLGTVSARRLATEDRR